MTAEATLTAPVAEQFGSPLAGYLDRFAAVAAATGGAVQLAERPLLSQLTLRAEPGSELREVLGGTLPEPGTVIGDGPLRTLGIGPDEWLVLAPPGSQRSVIDELYATIDGNGAVVDVSGQRTTIELGGPKSRQLLAKGCAIDLHPRVFHGSRCAQTMLARAQVVLVGQPGEPDGFTVLARSSFARHVAEWLLDAAEEYRLTGTA